MITEQVHKSAEVQNYDRLCCNREKTPVFSSCKPSKPANYLNKPVLTVAACLFLKMTAPGDVVGQYLLRSVAPAV